jgi:sulfide:quinone oxidoreductase
MAISGNRTGRAGPLKYVLIAGGGVAAIEAMLALKQLAGERLVIDLLAPERDFVYRPLAVAEPFGLGAARRFELDVLTGEAGAGHRTDGLAAVDADDRRVRTRSGEEIPYDVLVVAVGARVREALPGAITFWGTGDAAPFRDLLCELETGAAGEVVFCVPGGHGWPLPLYELALMTAAHFSGGRNPPQLTIATPESAPLELFGVHASESVRQLLADRGIGLCCGCYPTAVDDEGLRLVPGGHLAADRVVAIPRLEGPFVEGLPHDEHGFIPTDGFGRIEGLEDVGAYAVGDVTTFPVKQGGLATQQANAAAESIAAEMGAPVEPVPFRPVLRGLLLTGSEPSYLRAEIAGGKGETSVATSQPLWWPPGKIAGKHLAPWLARLARADLQPAPPAGSDLVDVEVDLSHPPSLAH